MQEKKIDREQERGIKRRYVSTLRSLTKMSNSLQMFFQHEKSRNIEDDLSPFQTTLRKTDELMFSYEKVCST